MKKPLTKKLSINKETVANLGNLAMKTVKAGQSPTGTCPAYCTTTAWQFCTYGCPTVIPFYCGTSLQCTAPIDCE